MKIINYSLEVMYLKHCVFKLISKFMGFKGSRHILKRNQQVTGIYDRLTSVRGKQTEVSVLALEDGARVCAPDMEIVRVDGVTL